MEIAIGALERGVRTLAKKLNKLGLKTEIDVFRRGHGGDPDPGPSYVEITATGTYMDRDGEEAEAWTAAKFFAGGYGGGREGRGEFGGMDGWRVMGAKGLDFILRNLQRDGWIAPARRTSRSSRRAVG